MKKTIIATAILACLHTAAAGAEKLTSFDHAAELTDQAKTILFQELNDQNADNHTHPAITCSREHLL